MLENGNESFLPLTEEEKAEALRLQQIAERAEQRALERARLVNNVKEEDESIKPKEKGKNGNGNGNGNGNVSFLSKQEREKLALERLEEKRQEQEKRKKAAEDAHMSFVTGRALEEKKKREQQELERERREREKRQQEESKESKELDSELKNIRDHYLGQGEKKRRILKPSEKFTRVFQFEWEKDDDTAKNDMNPLYQNRVKINALFGRGYIAGTDQREQRKESNFLMALGEKRMREINSSEANNNELTEQEKIERLKSRTLANEAFKRKQMESEVIGKERAAAHWPEKSLNEMTDRDWRIFREDFDIRIQGGRATLPLRYWSEANFPEEIYRAIRDANYEQPSPIQRQAIPIGQLGRDIIGIAETGSGKTAAFLIPLLCFLCKLPPLLLNRCADQGPLAIIMAPTRELAQQIEEECIKLARYTTFITANVVGGQNIEEQGFQLRKGVHVVIGTPGRIVDCLEHNYLVLNQCNYVVLDEADRMVDMGFEPQVMEVLESMGGLLKSEDESQAESQITSSSQLFRITTMFSATMPTEVERIARAYLRHPVVIKIGDEDSGKNKRIEQRVQFLTSENQKKNKLIEELQCLGSKEKAIVFVNSKKQGDAVGRYLDSSGLLSGVLHGGRSQDQREETLDLFRNGDIRVLVATDVAGRGLDIPEVSHVVNFDCPNTIVSYCHRIGRTGRAGRSGIAITFITDTDTEVMFSLKEYLESTNAVVPAQLAHHPAAQVAAGTRDDKGNIMGQKRETTKFAKK